MNRDTLKYLKNLISDKYVASVTPTSVSGVNKIIDKINFEEAKVIIEYGPGGGVFTRRLLSKMRPDAKLIVIEANTNFASSLTDAIDDPRLHIFNKCAENVLNVLDSCGEKHADYIISGIPFSMFSISLKDKILNDTNEALNKNGRFFVYQFLTSSRRGKRNIGQKLKEHMHIVDTDIEIRCFPPLRIYEVEANGYHPEAKQVNASY